MPNDQRNTTARPIAVTQQQASEAAQAVAAYCLLPDPRPYFANTQSWGEWAIDKLTTSINEYGFEDCARRQINGKIRDTSTAAGNQELPRNDPQYNAIIRDAVGRAREGAAQCQWREFDDAEDEPYEYSGRVVRGQCRPVRTPIR